MGFEPHLSSAEDVCEHFGVDQEKGLDDKQVKEGRDAHGWNELDKEPPTSLLALILEQFDDALVKILLAAATISFVLALAEEGTDGGIEAFVEPIVILVILILNAFVGVWQESNAEAALEALKELQSEHARCMRNGEMVTLEARELVPGDIVEVRVGDRVPADMRLISLHTTTMRLDQAQMTGESVSVMKDTTELTGKKDKWVIQDKTNMLFATTTVVNGKGVGVVISTGMHTEIGEIQKSVQEAKEDEEDTPLKKKLNEFGDWLSKVIMYICIIVWVINYKNFFDPIHGSVFKGCIYYFKIAVALAVAAIPEGLPAVITTCLALGTKKMAKKNAIVRKLPSVETLGCTTVICSDKTGTLTTNEMTVTTVIHFGSNTNDLKTYPVTGHSFDPNGEVVGASLSDKGLQDLAKVCCLCNESHLEHKGGRYTRVGEPTEAALKVLVEKLGFADPDQHAQLLKKRQDSPAEVVQAGNAQWSDNADKVAVLEFSRDRKSMSVLCRTKGASPTGRVTRNSAKNAAAGNTLYVKGAAEKIVERCSFLRLADGSTEKLTAKTKEVIVQQINECAGQGLRTLALAVKEGAALGVLSEYDGSRDHAAHKLLTKTEEYASIEADMTFVGLVAMQDPPRPEVRASIEECKLAGVRVIVITGDNQLTAETICRSIGVFSDTEDVSHKSYTGSSFFALSEQEQVRVLMEGGGGRVFSRTEPKHKQAIVKILKANGEVAAMTGDGVNDAPALKQADIGIAMGIAGTEVAKEAADMILADDNFATIVSAVEEGRAIYNNMQAFIRYLISSNIGEVAAIFITAALGFPEGLIPVQLLWVNLVTDGPPATALGFNPPDKDIMKRLPRSPKDDLITPWVFFRYMVVGVYVGFACVGVFAYWYMYYTASGDGHTLVTLEHLMTWTQCPKKEGIWANFTVADFGDHKFADNPCDYFTSAGKAKASTLSLSVLVAIEMFNALNALSEDGSLLQMPPWVNPYLILAMLMSFGMHAVILYIPSMADIFFVEPLDGQEWLVVLAFSLPVILIDEVLKFIGRQMQASALAARIAKDKKE